MSLAIGIASLVPVWLLGMFLLDRAGLRRRDGSDVPLEYAIGVAALALGGTLFVMLAVPLDARFAYALLAASALLAWPRGARPRLRVPIAGDGPARWLLAAAALVVVALFVAALPDRLSWDGFAIWTMKARMLFVDGTLPADSWIRPGPYDFAHPDYPLALPLLTWWQFEHAGATLAALASAGGAVWFGLLVWSFWTACAGRGAPERFAAGATLGLALFWPIWYFATGGTADVVMVLAFLGVAVELERAMRESPRPALGRAILWLALAALAKNEGLAAALVGAGAVSYVALRRLPRREAIVVGASSLIPVAMAASWRAWAATRGVDVEQLGSRLEPAALLDAAGALAIALGELALYRQWPPLVLLVGIGVWRWRRHELRWQSPAWAFLGIYLLLAFGVYLTTEQDLPWLLDTSLGRVVSAVAPAALFLTVTGMTPAGAAGAQPATTVASAASGVERVGGGRR